MPQTTEAGERAEVPDGRWLAWADWRATLALVLGLLALRVIYLVWLSPWELIHDEAHYWEWSRRLSLSYYSKGPGVAWLIAASTSLFGHTEWAVRLPAAVMSALGALALARLTTDVSDGDRRAGFLAAAAFVLIPIFQVEAQVMTIDPPFMTLWIVSCWIAWHAFSAHRSGERPWLLWALLGLTLGIGFLVKYIMVLLPPGILLYAIIRRRELPWDRRMTAAVGIAALAFTVAISPFLIWNAQHGWPALAHELGHLGAPGGDVPTQWDRPFAAFSLLELIASEIGVIGPPAFLLVVLAVVWSVRTRSAYPERWPAHLLMLCCGLPVIGFFLLVSLVSHVEPNWPASGFLTLLVLVAQGTVVHWPAWRRRRRRWEQRADAALQAGTAPPGAPRSAWMVSWKWMVGFGLVTAGIVAFPNLWARLPVVGRAVPMFRLSGAREMAARADAARAMLRDRTGEEPFVVAASYGVASELAFYMDGRPTVYGAGSYVGRRASQYDYWEDTDLGDRSLLGRPAVLVMRSADEWMAAFDFEQIETLGGDPPLHVGDGYGGPVR